MRVTVVCARSGRRRAGREVLGEGSDTCSGAVGAAFIVSSPYATVGGEGGLTLTGQTVISGTAGVSTGNGARAVAARGELVSNGSAFRDTARLGSVSHARLGVVSVDVRVLSISTSSPALSYVVHITSDRVDLHRQRRRFQRRAHPAPDPPMGQCSAIR